MVTSVRLRSAVAVVGRYPVLAGVDLDVMGGEVLALKGPNGAGKTSLLRVVAGLVPLAAGEATVLGLGPSADARELRRRVGLLGHRNGLYEDLSAEENVRFAVRARRLPQGHVAEALAHFGLGGRLCQLPVARLSAGQRRRVALATLAARRPELWLLDEPHAGLDAEHRQLLDALLGEVAAGGATVMVASHDVQAWAAAHRCVEMAGGVVFGGTVGAGRPAEPAGVTVVA